MALFRRGPRGSAGADGPGGPDPASRPSDDAPTPQTGPPWSGRPLRLDHPPQLASLPLLAADAAAAIAETEGVQITMVPDDVAVIDGVVDGFHRAGPGSDDLAEVLWNFGCLLGEIIVRNHGAVWVDTPPEHRELFGVPFVVRWPDDSLSNPIGKVFKRMDDGPEHNLVYFCHVFVAEHGG